jgi:hypothetical protein
MDQMKVDDLTGAIVNDILSHEFHYFNNPITGAEWYVTLDGNKHTLRGD